MSAHALVLMGCLFLSGMAGLIYQIAWVDQFSLVFGSAATAVVAVLAAFMAGLALGAAIVGRLSPRLRRPMRVFALLEIGIATSALLLPAAVGVAAQIQLHFMSGDGGQTFTVLLFSFLSSFVILIIPTSFMGATLPVVVRSVVRTDRQIGSQVGLLYALNALGAAAGTLVAAFGLLPRLGLDGTVKVAMVVNALVFTVAILLDRVESPSFEQENNSVSRLDANRFHWILPLVLVSGAVAFIYELFWTRLLTHLLGGSIYAFATMLATMLAGIALGSTVGGALAKRADRAWSGFALAQIGVAVSTIGAFYLSDRLPELMSPTSGAWDRDLIRGWFYASMTLFPAALFSGASFPFAVRVHATEPATVAAATARIFSWNTVGAVVGCILAGLLLLPSLGFWVTVKVAAIGNLLVALVASIVSEPRQRSLAVLALVGTIALALVPSFTPWRLLRHRPLASSSAPGESKYFGVGRHSTVLLTEEATGWHLSADGLPESRIAPEGAPLGHLPARWLALLPLALRPESRSLLVVGLGGGITLEEVPLGVEIVDVVELEQEIVRANQSIAGERRKDPLADSRVRLHFDDARNFMRLTDNRYDAIVSQPSHPWTSGSSQLFTREFFSDVESRLEKDGVFVQWIGLRFVDESLLRTMLASLGAVFAHVEAYQPPPGGAVFLVASQGPLSVEEAGGVALEQEPELWAAMGVPVLEDLLIARRLDAYGAKQLADDAPLNTDRHNLLHFVSPRVLRDSLGKEGAQRLFAPFDPLPAVANRLDGGYLVRRLLRLGEPGRARLVAQEISDPSTRRAAVAMTRIAAGERRLGVRALDEALNLDPESREALHDLVLLNRVALTSAEPLPNLEIRIASDSARPLVDAWRASVAGDWTAVRSLESELVDIGLRDPLFADATRLRVRWRLHSGEEALASEAMRLIDSLMLPDTRPSMMLLRAECAVAASDPGAAVQSLLQVMTTRNRAARTAEVVSRARQIFEGLSGCESVRGYEELRQLLGVEDKES